MPSHSRAFLWRLALLLAGLSMFGPFAIDAIFPAFPELQAEFGASHAAVQQSVSIYLAAYALMSIFHGPLSDALGRRPVILAGVLLFGLASIGAALSHSLFWLLVFRALQGISAGAGLIVGRALIRDCLDGDEAQKLMAQATMIFSVAPAIAPIVGGWILGWSDWNAIFWAIAMFTLLVLGACLIWLPETHPPQARTPLRPGSLARGSWAVLRNRRFLQLALSACFNFGVLFLYIASAPVLVLDYLGLNQQQFGWLFVPKSRTAKLGFSLSLLAAVLNLAYNLSVDTPQVPWAVLPMAINACGIGLVFPLLTIAMLDMYPRQRGTAASMQAFTGLSFNAVLAGIVAPLLAPYRLGMAGASLAMCLIAIVLWWRYRTGIKREPAISAGTMPQVLDDAERL